MTTTSVAGLYLLNARCTYATAFTSLLKLHLLWPLTFWSLQPEWPCEPLSSLEFFNIYCSVANVRWVLKALTFFHCETSVVSSISANRWPANTCLRLKLCIHCNTVVESDQKLQILIFISCSLTIFSFNLTAMNPLVDPIGLLKDASPVPLFISQ